MALGMRRQRDDRKYKIVAGWSVHTAAPMEPAAAQMSDDSCFGLPSWNSIQSSGAVSDEADRLQQLRRFHKRDESRRRAPSFLITREERGSQCR
jgi:hypothetical protein